MSGVKGFIVAVVCLWIAAGCQQALVPQIGILHSTPDFFLIVLTCLGLMADRKGGAILGFFCGALTGALAGANIAAYAITRTLTGFLLGWFNDLEMESNILTVAIATAIVTICAQLMLMFGVHRGPIPSFLAGTLLSAMVNGVLAIPVYVVLRKLLDPPNRYG